MKRIMFLALIMLPAFCQAQEISLEENYKSKKEKHRAEFKPLQKGDLNVNIGFSSIGKWYGLMYNGGAEYMLNDKVGVRGSFSSNNISGGLRSYGAHRYGVDLMYHFIQTKRWDVYAFAGLGYQRHRYQINIQQQGDRLIQYGGMTLNAGVGARYKFTPSFSAQLELGRVSSFGINKKFNLNRK